MVQQPANTSASPAAQAPAVIRNNWNPLSSRPGLDFPAFVTTLVAIATIEFVFGVYIQLPLHSARLSVDQKQIAVLYASWALVSVIGFFSVANTFMKRWATIYKMPVCPWWMKTVSRLFLLSPLLSIWATLFTMMYSAEGALFKDGESKSSIFVKALATLFVFHVAFLGYRLTQSEISFRNGTFLLKKETSARSSLPPGIVREMWLPGDAFYVHAYPYLSPLTKLGVSVYSDFARAKMLSDQTPDCASFYVGQRVPNCYLESYREVALKRPFVTPAFGVFFEQQYRKNAMQGLKPKEPMEAFSLNAISIENLVVLLEPGDMIYDRKKFLKPVGFLSLYGSPELPAISVGQDLQHFVLGSKFVPMIAPEMAKLSKSLDDMKGALTPEQAKLGTEKMDSLHARLKALESDPLALR